MISFPAPAESNRERVTTMTAISAEGRAPSGPARNTPIHLQQRLQIFETVNGALLFPAGSGRAAVLSLTVAQPSWETTDRCGVATRRVASSSS